MVAGARRSCGRRQLLAVEDVAEALRRPSTSQMVQEMRMVLANKIVPKGRQGAVSSYLNRTSESSGGSGARG
jgi:hypothetical protein